MRHKEMSFFSSQRFLMHFLFWFVHLLFFAILGGAGDGNYGQHLLAQLATLPIRMLQIYGVLYYLLPAFLLKKKYILFVLGLSLLCILTVFSLQLLNHFLVMPLIFKTGQGADLLSFTPSALWMAVISGYLMVLALVIKLTRIWHSKDKTAQLALNDKLDAELNYLKAQIHPHFLFNTLNNLYTLALKKSEKAPHVIDRLAQLLRYILYEANQEKVSLARDIENAHNYILLEELRYGKRLKISWRVSGDTDNKEIAPLILLPFIENSFKHGVSGELSDCQIEIQINVEENLLTLEVVNSIAKMNNPLMGSDEGIGLKNVKRRLDIIYKDKHTLELTAEDLFRVNLTLDLA